MLRGFMRALLPCALGVLLPATVFAQASFTGVARDTSGAVLPGVTVEAASPVLIEKVRTTVTDGNGRYQLVGLRPGAYTMTFTLAGFNTVRREMVTLAGSANVAVDAELRVGALEETITVTGEAPVVDVQSTTRQTVLDNNTIATLPTWRNFTSLTTLIPGTTGADTDERVSGLQGTGGSVGIHGARAGDQRVTLNGVNIMTLQASGAVGGQSPDVGSAAEVTVDTSAVSADLATGGVRVNFIPRDGGNQWANSTFLAFANSSFQSDNLDDELVRAGLPAAESIKKNWDINESFGGPIRRDRVWFWFSGRYNGVDNFAPIFLNKNAFDPTKWTYEPDTTRQAVNSGRLITSSVRVTWQATPRNKIAGTYKADKWCECPDNISATVSAEAGRDRRFPRLRQEHLEWTSPITSRLMADAVGMHLFERWGNMHLQEPRTLEMLSTQASAIPPMISVQEQSTGMTYRMGTTWNNNTVPNYAYRASLSYVTGSHNVKIGFNRTTGYQITRTYNFQPYSYRFNNGVPNRVTIYAAPYELHNDFDNDLGLYAQNRWTLNRYTVSAAIRYDTVQTSFPEQRIGPGSLVPTRNLVLPGKDNIDYNDLSYRSGFTWDVRGNGRTALKLTANKYLAAQTLSGIGSAPNPFNTLVNQTTRSWSDANRNFVPDCNLVLPGANGECGAMADANFGTSVPGATYDADLLTGRGHRGSNWEFSAGAQHELFPRISLDVGYFRRIYQSFSVTDNRALSAADFDFFSIKVPSHPGLPDGGGYTLEGLRALKPAAFGRPAQNFNTLTSKYGEQSEHWNGVDVILNARLQNGVTMQLGSSTGRTWENDCELSQQLPENNLTRPLQFCDRMTPWLTQVKGYVTYVVPVVDVQVAGTFRSTPGDAINTSFVANNAYLAANSTLGRALAGGESSLTISLLEPNTKYLDRRNQLDLRIGKVFRVRGNRAAVNLDLYNAINSNTVIAANESFDRWLAPTSILSGRLAKVSFNLNF